MPCVWTQPARMVSYNGEPETSKSGFLVLHFQDGDDKIVMFSLQLAGDWQSVGCFEGEPVPACLLQLAFQNYSLLLLKVSGTQKMRAYIFGTKHQNHGHFGLENSKIGM